MGKYEADQGRLGKISQEEGELEKEEKMR